MSRCSCPGAAGHLSWLPSVLCPVTILAGVLGADRGSAAAPRPHSRQADTVPAVATTFLPPAGANLGLCLPPPRAAAEQRQWQDVTVGTSVPDPGNILVVEAVGC